MNKVTKEVKLVIGSGGRVEIHADGPKGYGTAKFTMDLAQALGEITERHKGYHHTHEQDHTHEHTHVHEN